jgi:hypothetical protein
MQDVRGKFVLNIQGTDTKLQKCASERVKRVMYCGECAKSQNCPIIKYFVQIVPFAK